MPRFENGHGIRDHRESRRRPDAPAPSQCFATAYDDGVERLAAVIANAVGERARLGPSPRRRTRAPASTSSPQDPALAHLLLVESLAAARPARLEYERTLSAPRWCPAAALLRPRRTAAPSPRRRRGCSRAASPPTSPAGARRRSGAPAGVAGSAARLPAGADAASGGARTRRALRRPRLGAAMAPAEPPAGGRAGAL